MDASGSKGGGGRPLWFFWTVTSSDASNGRNVSAYLNASVNPLMGTLGRGSDFGAPKLVIPAQVMMVVVVMRRRGRSRRRRSRMIMRMMMMMMMMMMMKVKMQMMMKLKATKKRRKVVMMVTRKTMTSPPSPTTSPSTVPGRPGHVRGAGAGHQLLRYHTHETVTVLIPLDPLTSSCQSLSVPAAYAVRVRVTNFLGYSTDSAVVTVARVAAALPLVRIQGASTRMVYRSQPLAIFAQVM
jgi:hypothetical protein